MLSTNETSIVFIRNIKYNGVVENKQLNDSTLSVSVVVQSVKSVIHYTNVPTGPKITLVRNKNNGGDLVTP